MSPPNIFADRLVTRRNRLNLSQGELAERVGISVSSVSAWERGVNPPTLRMMERLANVMSVPVSWLLGDAESTLREESKPFEPSEAECREHFEAFMQSCQGDKARLGWTLIQLHEQFPLDRWKNARAVSKGYPVKAKPEEANAILSAQDREKLTPAQQERVLAAAREGGRAALESLGLRPKAVSPDGSKVARGPHAQPGPDDRQSPPDQAPTKHASAA